MNNLIVRSLSGIVFLVILIGSILFSSISYGLLMIFIITVGMLEYYKLLLPTNHNISKVLGVISGVSLFTLMFLQNTTAVNPKLFLLVALPVAAIFISELYSKSQQPMNAVAITLSAIIYIALPFSLMNMLVFQPNFQESGVMEYHPQMLLVFFIILWTNDVGAYCVGSLLGRSGKHKLFERISPKKSWEGFIGGLTLSILVAILLYYTWGKNFSGVAPIHWAIVALLISVFGTLGDLVESMLKRSVGVKDSGNIMPGHGGILDRFDAVLIALPIMLVYWQLVANL